MIPKNYNLIIARLKSLRKKHALTQKRFAHIAKMSYKYYQALEAGRKKDIRLSTVERLAMAYGLTAHQFLSPVNHYTVVRGAK